MKPLSKLGSVVIALAVVVAMTGCNNKTPVEVSEKFHLVVDHTQSLADMIAAGKYGWTNRDITADNFPTTGSCTAEMDAVFVLLGRDATTDEVLRELNTRGLRPATMAELLAFGSAFPEKQMEFPIVGLGSVWDHGGRRYFGYLGQGIGGRELDLFWLALEWFGGCRFLAVPK